MADHNRNVKFKRAKKSTFVLGNFAPTYVDSRSKGQYILLSVALLILVAGVAGLLFHFMQSSQSTKPLQNTNLNLSGSTSAKQPDQTYQIEVTSRNITNIELEIGDSATIAASGQIRLGMLAGVADPEGVPGFTDYNIYPDNTHGALLARIRDKDDQEKWRRIGKNGNIVAKHAGNLEFLVNDKDPGNNKGSFKVTVQIFKSK